MKIACLQFNPAIGAVEENIKQADTIIGKAHIPDSLDLLVLPELAFTGYNFPDLKAIEPYLEPTTSGRTTQWALATAKRLRCHVTVGYPEVSSETDDEGNAINYNSTVTVEPEGMILANYRKSFLYFTDEAWASEGSGFHCAGLGTLGTVGLGICMDINPYQFTAPWDAYEFGTHVVNGGAKLVVLSMAWLTHDLPEDIALEADRPDGSTVAYWLDRLSPLTRAALDVDEEVLVVIANRIGTEVNEVKTIHAKNGQVVELGDSVSYAGSSCIMRFRGGEASILDMLGKGEKALLLVDTSQVSEGRLSSAMSLLMFRQPSKFAIRRKASKGDVEDEGE